MSLENYAIHIAPRGGKVDLAVDDINARRKAASDVRWDYAKSKGATGLYQNERAVSGLIFRKEFALPEGWSRLCSAGEDIVAEPKAKDRTAVSRAQSKALKAELSALPPLPGADEFSKLIECSMVLGQTDTGRGFCLRNAFYERIGETTFVMTPWSTKQEETGNAEDDNKVKTALIPEGCERVGLSVYYAAKEKEAP